MMPIHTRITATGLSRFHRFLRSGASSFIGSVVGDAAPRRMLGPHASRRFDGTCDYATRLVADPPQSLHKVIHYRLADVLLRDT